MRVSDYQKVAGSALEIKPATPSADNGSHPVGVAPAHFCHSGDPLCSGALVGHQTK